ncbi:LysR family transcriptional regulator [Roseibium limicola]|uniref:LysR family transcriptional regulator n=1 Tax=Roseibium limicola TaxID=2816037 RepID=A0A939EKX0_9HYPH|nr:LysR family transcriptional regulator [Roseibium limicola]MBO0344501.1 LysR family transcriptional regulator [Roseibium limicola]
MQIQAITYFNELVKCRSIRQAAQNLGVSATAISRQLDNLEYYFGAPLMERGARGIELTAAGEVVAEHLHSANRSFGQAKQFIDDLRGLRRGEVCVHVNGAASGSVLAHAVASFARDYPAVRLTIVESSARDGLMAVARGDADLSLTMFSPDDVRVNARVQVPLAYRAIMAPDHPLAALKQVGLEDLASVPLTLPDRSYSLRQALETRLKRAGMAPADVAFTTASMTVQKELARLGATLLILPELSVVRDLELGQLVARPLAPDARVDTQLQLSLPQDTSLSFAAERFSRHLALLLLSDFQGVSLR